MILGKVTPRITGAVLGELRAMSPATIDRHLAPHKHAAYPGAVSVTRPSHISRSSIPLRTAINDPVAAPPGFSLSPAAGTPSADDALGSGPLTEVSFRCVRATGC